jgi:hypothetical protein
MSNGELHAYDDYLRATLLPFTPAGIHLIAASPRDRTSPKNFSKASNAYFRRIAEREAQR